MTAEEKAAEKWHRLVHEASQVTAKSDVVKSLPAYADLQQLRFLKEEAKEKWISYFISASTGLWMLIHIPEIFVPLLATKKSESIPCLFMRYTATAEISLSWFTTDLSDTGSDARKWLEKVRLMHNNIADLMTRLSDEHSCLRLPDGKVWVSQKDMVITQWAYCGLALLFPAACGLDPNDLTGQRLIMHFWHVLGHMLGIREEYNLCSGSPDENIELCRIIFHEVYRPVIGRTLNSDDWLAETSQQMAADVVQSLEPLAPLMSSRVLHRYWSDVMLLEHKPKLTAFEHLTMLILKFLTGSLLRVRLIARFLSGIWITNCNRVVKNRQLIARRLQEKHPEVIYKLCDFIASD